MTIMIHKFHFFIELLVVLNFVYQSINCFNVNGIEFDKNQIHKEEVYQKYIKAVEDENQAIALKRFKESLEIYSSQLDSNFEKQIKKFFWDKQNQANSLDNNDNTNSNVIKKISNLLAKIVYNQYAFEKKANDLTRDILEDSNSAIDVNWLASSAKALDKRIHLRGYLNGFEQVNSLWQTIYLIFKHYLTETTTTTNSKELKQLFIECYDERQRYGKLAYKTSLEMDREYSQYARLLSKEKFEDLKSFISRIDSLIDNKSGCKETCSSLPEGSWETYFAKPLFSNNSNNFSSLINQYVPRDLIEAIEFSENSLKANNNNLIEISQEEASKVSELDIEEFEDNLMKKEGLLQVTNEYCDDENENNSSWCADYLTSIGIIKQ